MDNKDKIPGNIAKIKRVLELLLEMILGLKNIAKEHEDRLDALQTSMGFQKVANEAVIGALKETIEVQEGHDAHLEISRDDIETLRARDKENRARIKALEREMSNLRALILKQYDIDLRQGGLFFQSWYEERDECLATVTEDAKRSPL